LGKDWELVYIEEVEKNEELSLLEYVFNTVNGCFREWTVVGEQKRFTKNVFVSDAESLYRRKISLFGPKPAEYHMSVGTFVEPPATEEKLIGWTFILDVDHPVSFKKRRAFEKLIDLLNLFGVYHLTDNRFHIWMPEWQTSCTTRWDSYIGTINMTYIHYYLTYTAKLNEIGALLDGMLWKNGRHKIRMPYSIHLQSGSQQQMYHYQKPIPLNEFEMFWLGKSVENVHEYLLSFREFISHAVNHGRIIYEAVTDVKEIRPGRKNSYGWIEKTLETPIPVGYRGMLLFLAIMPYLVNVKKLEMSECKRKVHTWLDMSYGNRIVDRDLYMYPTYSYRRIQSLGILPASLKTISEKYPNVFRIVQELCL